MNLVIDGRSERAQLLYDKADSLEAQIKTIRQDIEEEGKLLERYSHTDFEWITTEIIIPRMNNIAHDSMNLPVDDRDNRLRAEGEYNVLKSLSMTKSEVQESYAGKFDELEKLRQQLATTVKQIKRTKE